MLQQFKNMGFSKGSDLDAKNAIQDINDCAGFNSGIDSNWVFLKSRHNGHDLFVFINESLSMIWLIIVGY